MSRFGQELIESAREALAIARGEMEPARVYVPDAPDVAGIRKRLGLSQEKFAERFGLTKGAVRDWEQRRRVPDLPARTLLTVIDYAPETVQRAVAAQRKG